MKMNREHRRRSNDGLTKIGREKDKQIKRKPPITHKEIDEGTIFQTNRMDRRNVTEYDSYYLNTIGLSNDTSVGLRQVIDAALTSRLTTPTATRHPENQKLLYGEHPSQDNPKQFIAWINALERKHPRYRNGNIVPVDEFSLNIAEEMRFATRLYLDSRLINGHVEKAALSYLRAVSKDVEKLREKQIEATNILLEMPEVLEKINRNLMTNTDYATTLRNATNDLKRRSNRNHLKNKTYGETMKILEERSKDFAFLMNNIQDTLVKLEYKTDTKELNAMKRVTNKLLDDLHVASSRFRFIDEKNRLDTIDFPSETKELLKKLKEDESVLISTPIIVEDTQKRILSGIDTKTSGWIESAYRTDNADIHLDNGTEYDLSKRAYRRIRYKNGIPSVSGITGKNNTITIIPKSPQYSFDIPESLGEFMDHFGKTLEDEAEVNRVSDILKAEGFIPSKLMLQLLTDQATAVDTETGTESIDFITIRNLKEKYIAANRKALQQNPNLDFPDIGAYDWRRLTDDPDPVTAINRYFNPFTYYDATTDSFVSQIEILPPETLIRWGKDIKLIVEDPTNSNILYINGQSQGIPRTDRKRIAEEILNATSPKNVSEEVFLAALDDKSKLWKQSDLLKLSLYLGWDYSRNGGKNREEFIDRYLASLPDGFAFNIADNIGVDEDDVTSLAENNATLNIWKKTLLDTALLPVISNTYEVMNDRNASPAAINAAKAKINALNDQLIKREMTISANKLDRDLATLYKFKKQQKNISPNVANTVAADRIAFLDNIKTQYDIAEDIHSLDDYEIERIMERQAEKSISVTHVGVSRTSSVQVQPDQTRQTRQTGQTGNLSQNYFETLRKLFVGVLFATYNLKEKMKTDALFHRTPHKIEATDFNALSSAYETPIIDTTIGDLLVTPETERILFEEAIEIEKEKRKPVEVVKPTTKQPRQKSSRSKINASLTKWRAPRRTETPRASISRLSGNMGRINIAINEQLKNKTPTYLENELQSNLLINSKDINNIKKDLKRQNISEQAQQIKLGSAREILLKQKKDIDDALLTNKAVGGLDNIPLSDLRKLQTKTQREITSLDAQLNIKSERKAKSK